jgi:hypothetical protein
MLYNLCGNAEPERPHSIVPIGFSQKTHLFPNHRCVIICFGFDKTAGYLEKFVNNLKGCNDIENVVKEIENNFYKTIDFTAYLKRENETIIPGSLQILGYSELEQKMVWYVVNVHWTHLTAVKKEFISGTVICIPFIKDKSAEAQIGSRQDLGIHDVLIELMKLQYQESLNPLTRTSALGGEIMITTVLSKPYFSMSVEFPYRFENFALINNGYQFSKIRKH